MELVVDGHTTIAELAKEMGCSERTVKAYLTRLRVDNNIEKKKFVLIPRLIYLYFEDQLKHEKKEPLINESTRSSRRKIPLVSTTIQ